jgi:hypothetical protein
MAQEADPVGSVNWSSSEPVAVIEFQGACFAASAAMLVGEAAAAAVALEDLAFDGVRNVPRGRGARVAGRSRSRLPTRGESLFHHLFDEHVDAAVETATPNGSVGDSGAEFRGSGSLRMRVGTAG